MKRVPFFIYLKYIFVQVNKVLFQSQLYLAFYFCVHKLCIYSCVFVQICILCIYIVCVLLFDFSRVRVHLSEQIGMYNRVHNHTITVARKEKRRQKAERMRWTCKRVKYKKE